MLFKFLQGIYLIWIHALMVLYVQVPSKNGGPPEKKEVLLEDHDPIWLELRHAHIAYVYPNAFM